MIYFANEVLEASDEELFIDFSDKPEWTPSWNDLRKFEREQPD
jgi:hypothetical protein